MEELTETNSYNFWTKGGTIWRVVLLRTGVEAL